MEPPRSRGRRFFKLAGMTTTVAGRYAASRVGALFRNSDRAQEVLSGVHRVSGQRIAETLGELKGAVMKVGQMASIGSEWLPPELAKPLAALQKEAPPVDYEVIASQVEAELGAPPEVLFERFDEQPFASASIGQVHRARTDDGREVVVKVQYPGVDESVDSDLLQLRVALRAAGLIRLRRKVIRELWKELRARLHEELDYTNEAANVRRFRELHAPDPFVAIPEVVGERSAKRVLTLTYLPGVPMAELDGAAYDQDLRDTVGRNLCTMLALQIFRHGVVHADPNPANFAVSPADGSLVVYDFGCVKKLEPWIVEAYQEVLLAYERREFHRVDDALIKIGARDLTGPEVSPQTYARYYPIIEPLLRPDEPYDFGASTLERQSLALSATMPGLIRSFQPPPQGVFVNRLCAGHFGNLRRLGARLTLLELLEPFVNAA